MENLFPSSNSILENTGFLESANSSKEVTLTKNSSHDFTVDDANVSFSGSLSFENNVQKIRFPDSTHKMSLNATFSEKNLNRQMPIQRINPKVTLGSISPTKDLHTGEEKLRQNEEILLQSSFSSETDSWESIFPHISEENKFHDKDKIHERQCSDRDIKVPFNENYRNPENMFPNFVKKTPFESTSYFIDAASLVDEECEIKMQANQIETNKTVESNKLLTPSQSVPCTSVDYEDRPNALSENEDSIEQNDSIGSDFLQKDMSSDIFQMSPTTQGSFHSNTFISSRRTDNLFNNAVELETSSNATENEVSLSPTTLFLSRTPNSSMMLLKNSALQQYEPEESKSIATNISQESHSQLKSKYNESSPIISGGASIEDHLPHIGRCVGSPLTRRKKESQPIVSGAYVREVESNNLGKSLKMSCASAWVVDMSSSPKSYKEQSEIITNETRSVGRSGNSLTTSDSQNCSLENFSNLDCFVDSDSSDKSGREKFSKFYIDLSTICDSEAPKKNNDTNSEKKNIFCMYIDLGEKSTLKEMPDRLSSSQSIRKYTTAKPKCLIKKKTTRESYKICSTASLPKNGEPNNCSGAVKRHESLSVTNSFSGRHKEVMSVINTDSDAETEENKIRVADKQYNHNTAAVILEDPTKEHPANSFVKLSDLDKPTPKTDTVLRKEMVRNVAMTRSIPDYNWGDKNNSSTLRSTIQVISSFHSENALSLNRLFPHLKNEFSRSMPGSLSDRTRSPLRLAVSSNSGDIDQQSSDMSEASSVQSSICVSVVENSTTEETSQTSKLIGNCQSRLGRDLLRMFLEEIAPDVIVEVSGRRIKAHKCILSSRCQYFAGILSGGWVESAGNVIVLPPFSFNTVHFALCHIYSGISSIPDSSNIVELATIADMLELEGLKEAIMFTLRAKYCHHFHRPCQLCTAGVLECFPLSSVYGLDDLYRKCLRWITKYFYKVWPTKAFATLPKELQDKCYQQHIVNMTIDNLVSTVYGCGITVASLQNNRWADIVMKLCRRVVDAAAQYAAPRLLAALRAVAPLSTDAPLAAKQALDDCLAAAIEWAAPDEVCRAYAFLSSLVREIRSTKPNFIVYSNSSVSDQDSLLYAHASSWRFQCEGALVRAAPRVVGTQAFMDLPSDLRNRLRKLGCIINGNQAVTVTSSLQKWKCTSTNHVQVGKASRSLDIDHVRSSFVPYAQKPRTAIGSTDILKSNNDIKYRKSNRLTPPMVRTTKAQEERAKFNLTKNNQSQDRSTNQTATTRVTSFKNTKPRYLEPRTYNNNERTKPPAGKKIVPNTFSYSDSSRNSSPVQVRNKRISCPDSRQATEVRARQITTKKSQGASRSGTTEPSTDSLSDSQNSNKYATYTKARHTSKGSVECIQSTKSQVTAQLPAADNKLKTKIPVYLNQNRKFNYISPKGVSETQDRVTRSPAKSNSANIQSRYRASERARPCEQTTSRSSSYKMIPTLVKAPHSNKSTPKSPKQTKNQANRHEEHDQPPIHLMERSGTFLKDESTFGNITTNIDEVLS